MVAKAEVRPLTARQREGRAVNAVAQLLRRTLSVPNIYIDRPVPLLLLTSWRWIMAARVTCTLSRSRW